MALSRPWDPHSPHISYPRRPAAVEPPAVEETPQEPVEAPKARKPPTRRRAPVRRRKAPPPGVQG